MTITVYTGQTLKLVFMIKDQDGDAADISIATVKDVVCKLKGEVEAITKTGAFTDTGADGGLTCTLEGDDMAKAGYLECQAMIEDAVGDYPATIIGFYVEQRLE